MASTATRIVLISEDDPLIRTDAVEAFLDSGWKVLEAADGQEALLLIAQQPTIDALFTDIDLNSENNGWDVAEACRSRHTGVFVVYTSGMKQDATRRVSGSLFFSKPYEMREIIAACQYVRL